jgi:TRAP-type mannitol/chloroaromatic compound transport system permease small subunit
MKIKLAKIATGINRLNEWVGRGVAWLTTILVVLVCIDVVARYLFNETQAWVMELEWHLFALIFLLGAGYAFKHDRHVRVDVFYDNFSEREKAWVNLIGTLVFLLPWTAILAYAAFDYAMISYLIGEGSPDPGGLPGRYVIKFAIVAGLIFLLLQGLAKLIESLLILRKGPSSKEQL